MTIMSRSLFYFLLTVFFLIFINSHGYESSPRCPSHGCGNVTIKYPFWSIDDDTGAVQMHCGYPDFGLTCSNGEAILKLAEDPYYVRDINYTSHTITLVDIDASDPKLGCPRARHNLSIGTLPLGYTSLDLNISFYFNCSSDITSAHAVECMSSGGLKSYVTETANGVETPDWFGVCQENVLVTVMKTHVAGNDLNAAFASAMNSGFQLDWRVLQNCAECEASEGYCAHTNITGEFFCACNDRVRAHHCRGGMGLKVSRKIIIGTVAGGTWILASIFLYFVFKRSSSIISMFSPGKRATNNKDLEKFTELLGGTLAIKKYNFSDVKKITNRFEDKLGQGGYGSVFKGKLADGRLVAVKILNASKGNGEEFINEVASISRTSHVNIVTLVGFCLEGSKRVLIYDFMPNGSLEKFTNRGSTRHLGWETLYQIAVGVARGLEYLHRGCNTRIVHFDIKPHNILLDQDFCPKISDFGLARLCNRKESIMSMWEARGTIGYIAPEVFSRLFGGVSHKSDVYSYGMMILEMVGERENDDSKTDGTSEKYFPYWIYKRLELVQEHELHAATEEVETKRKLAIVGLWCIQTNPSDRPSMSKVIEMLEGPVETLKIPPQPFLSSPVKSPPYSSNASTA